MKLELHLSSAAEADLDGHWWTIAQNNLPAADRMLDKLAHRFEQLRQFPESGEDIDYMLPGHRRTVVVNYVIYYRICKEQVQIVRVLHGARDAGSALGI